MLRKNYKSELSATFKLALPIIVAQLGVVLMGVSDNIIVGRLLGAINLGAAGIANSIAFLSAAIAVGGLAAVAPMVSKMRAEEDSHGLGHLFVSTLVVSTIFSVVLTGIAYMVYLNFHILDQTAQIEALGRPFFLLIVLSNIPMIFFLALKQFSDGFSKPKIVMQITLVGLAVNIFGDIALIKGWGFLPELGLNGAAYATIITRIFMTLFLIYYLRSHRLFKSLFVMKNWQWDGKMVWEIINRSVPSGLQAFFEIAAFTFAVIMMGWISETALAAHHIAINIASTTYMMASGFSYAGSIRIGEAWGNRSGRMIRLSGKAAYTLVIAFMATTGILLMLFKKTIIGIYIDDAEVLAAAVPMLMVAALFQLSDGIQTVGLGALRGLADIKIPTYITFVAYWVLALPIGYFMAFHWGVGAIGIWIGLLLGLTFSATFLFLRFRNVSRRIIISLVRKK